MALSLVAMVPLAIWSGGCGRDPIVEPPGDGGPTDSSKDVGGPGPDGANAMDGGGDDGGANQCCSQAEGNQTRCSPDGTEVLQCAWWYAAGPACADNPNTSYGYAWRVTRCPNGCAVSTSPLDSVTMARCQ